MLEIPEGEFLNRIGRKLLVGARPAGLISTGSKHPPRHEDRRGDRDQLEVDFLLGPSGTRRLRGFDEPSGFIVCQGSADDSDIVLGGEPDEHIPAHIVLTNGR